MSASSEAGPSRSDVGIRDERDQSSDAAAAQEAYAAAQLLAADPSLPLQAIDIAFDSFFDDFMAGGISRAEPTPNHGSPSHGRLQSRYAQPSSSRSQISYGSSSELDHDYAYGSAGEQSDGAAHHHRSTAHQNASSMFREYGYAQPNSEAQRPPFSRTHTLDAYKDPEELPYDDQHHEASAWDAAPSNSPPLPSPEPLNMRVAPTPAPGQLHPWAAPNSIPQPKAERVTPANRRAQSLASHKLRKSSSVVASKARRSASAAGVKSEYDIVPKLEPFEPSLLPEPPQRPPVWPELHVLVKLRRCMVGEIEMRDVRVPAPRWEAVGTAATRNASGSLAVHEARAASGPATQASSEQQGSAPIKYSHAALLRSQGRALARDDRKLDARALWIARVAAEEQRTSGTMSPVPWDKGNVVLLRNVRRGSKGLS